jgi:hypothetical protein
MFETDRGQAVAAIGRLDQPVTVVAQQRDEERAVRREVVNDEDGRDYRPPLGSVRAVYFFNVARYPTRESTSSFGSV